jgi:hypothetical protein
VGVEEMKGGTRKRTTTHLRSVALPCSGIHDCVVCIDLHSVNTFDSVFLVFSPALLASIGV